MKAAGASPSRCLLADDDAGNLTTVDYPGTLIDVSLAYDAHHRVTNRVDGVGTTFCNVPEVSYTRGLDLSGRFEGAGGIGGLLARSHGYSGGNWSTHSYYHADGNGNVTMLLNGSQTAVATYRYDPFGRTLASSGSLAMANTLRFSSKPIHHASGLYDYGYRWYSPNLQRWISRDPIEEEGGRNLYVLVGNDPLDFVDAHGLWFWKGAKNLIQGTLAKQLVQAVAGWAFDICKDECITRSSCVACCGQVAAITTTGVSAIATMEYVMCASLPPPGALICIPIVTAFKAQALLGVKEQYDTCLTNCPSE